MVTMVRLNCAKQGIKLFFTLLKSSSFIVL
uniref:Uncharacterized protein n=1 Tax=Arundo donax TaxID=35708 RepID=A0A0A9A5K2_ARUDO